MVCNEYFGKLNKLPFDLPTRRIIPYLISPESEDKATERKKLEGLLENQIRFIIENENLVKSEDEDNKKENVVSSILSEAEKLAEKRGYEKFRAEWFRSKQSVEDVVRSINEIILSIHNHFLPGNNFSKAGIQLHAEKYLKSINDQDFGCQLDIIGVEQNPAFSNTLSRIRLIITLFKKIPQLNPRYPNTDRIESIVLAPDIAVTREIIWKDESNENVTYSSEEVVEKFFEMLIEQIKKGKPLDETVEGGRYLVDGQYVDAWGNPIEDNEYVNDNDFISGGW